MQLGINLKMSADTSNLEYYVRSKPLWPLAYKLGKDAGLFV